MLNTDTIHKQSIHTREKFFTLRDRDLFTLITGRSSEEMSVRYTYPFIVDWQLSEENKVEPTQVQ